MRKISLGLFLGVLGVWLLTALLLLFPAALLAARAADAQAMSYISAGVSFVSAAAAGARAMRSRQGGRLLCGLLCGLGLTLLLLLVGFIIGGGAPASAGVLSVGCFSVAGCVLGSALGGRGGRVKRRSVNVTKH